MDESTPKVNKDNSGEAVANFIKNPLDKTVNPRHIVGFAFEKRRAKSLLRKIDKAYIGDNEKVAPKSNIEIILGFDEIISQMRGMGYIDKKLMKLLRENVYQNPITAQQRKDLWYLASGAKLKKDMYPDYYTKLAYGIKNYPEYFSNMIEKDLKRTFPEKIYDPKDPIIQKMRTVLNTYAKRNPTIGYCQGLNFIVARIIEVIEDEEQSFWIFCSLLEDLLPVDYFSSMVGVLVDQKIFSEMVNQFDKPLARKFSNLEVDPSLFSLQWFVCCYVSTVSADLCNAIWDVLFIEGSCALYKAGLVFLSCLKPQILQVREFNEIFGIIDDNSKFIEDPAELKKKMYQIYLSKRLVNILRRQYQWIIEVELQSLETKKKHKNPIVNTRDLLTCREDWPVCIDVLENSKQKKRNTSAFALRVDKVQGSKSTYFSQEFKHTHYHNSRSNVSKKKGQQVKERGRDKFKTFNVPFEQAGFLKGILEGNLEEAQRQMDSKGFFKAETMKKGRYDNVDDSDENPNEESSEFSKYSEDPRSIQKQLVIGRQYHSCQESLRLKKLNYKKPVSPSQKNKKAEIMAQYVKSSLDGLRDSKSPTPHRNINRLPTKIRTETKIPPVNMMTRSFVSESSDKPPEAKGGAIGNFLRGLFGSNYLRRQEEPKPEVMKPKLNAPTVTFSVQEIPKRDLWKKYEEEESDDEEEITRRNHRKMTIYNYIVDSNADQAADSAKKSVLFMKEFFKE